MDQDKIQSVVEFWGWGKFFLCNLQKHGISAQDGVICGNLIRGFLNSLKQTFSQGLWSCLVGLGTQELRSRGHINKVKHRIHNNRNWLFIANLSPVLKPLSFKGFAQYFICSPKNAGKAKFRSHYSWSQNVVLGLIQGKKALGNTAIDASWEGMHYISIKCILVNNSLGATRGKQIINEVELMFVPN